MWIAEGQWAVGKAVGTGKGGGLQGGGLNVWLWVADVFMGKRTR